MLPVCRHWASLDPGKVVRENKHLVRAVIFRSRFEFPCRRVTVNLTPADLLKEEGRPVPILAVVLWQVSPPIRRRSGNLATTCTFTSRGRKRVPLTTGGAERDSPAPHNACGFRDDGHQGRSLVTAFGGNCAGGLSRLRSGECFVKEQHRLKSTEQLEHPCHVE